MNGYDTAVLDRLLRSYEVRMKLEELCIPVPGAHITGDGSRVISGLSYNSRSVKAGDLFIAVQGTASHGNRFAQEAIRQGAIALMTDKPIDGHHDVPVIFVPDARTAKAEVAAHFYRHPSQRLSCIGITGTNGKTTVSYMLKAILEQDGQSTGLIGTIRHHVGKRTETSKNTTPDSVDLQRYLAEMVDENQARSIMEVSSHALSQNRVGEVVFKTGVFTNLSREHLDYHASMEAYGDAKALLFSSLPPDAVAVINADDPAGEKMIQACRCPVIRYGFCPGVDVTAEVRRLDIDGFSLILKTPLGEVDITSRLPGRFNVVNAMAASAAAISLDAPLSAIKSGFETLRSIEGRMESIDCGQDFRVIVDYAHTPDALENILSNLKPITVGRLITVFGCGGDRDRSKRPLMAEAAGSLSTHSFITSDNPRTEDPRRIIDDILQGIVPGISYDVEPDRKRAIEAAIAMARGGDIVVIAGKGHENYQILNDGTVDFDDRQVTKETLWNLYC